MGRLKELWAELTAPCPTDEDYEHLEIERRILWRKVDQLEAENAFLRSELEKSTKEITEVRHKLHHGLTDLDKALIESYSRVEHATMEHWSSEAEK